MSAETHTHIVVFCYDLASRPSFNQIAILAGATFPNVRTHTHEIAVMLQMSL